jgi:hypothetical protein
MRRSRFLAALLALGIPVIGIGQSLSFEDADTPSEAVGMMTQTMRAAQVMRDLCVARFPKEQLEIDANLLKWRTTEAEVLKKTDVHWAAMVKKQPNMADALGLVDSSIKGQMDAAAKLPGDVGSDILLQRCKRHFADLASGIWRKRTPHVYEFMDRAP